MSTPDTITARQALLRELCEQINLWDQDAVIDDEDELAEHWLLPVIDRHVAALVAERTQRMRDLAAELDDIATMNDESAKTSRLGSAHGARHTGLRDSAVLAADRIRQALDGGPS